MDDKAGVQPVVLEYAQRERPFETPTQRVFQGIFVALILVFGLLCLFGGFILGGSVFLGMGAFFAAVMFFPLHH